MSAGLDLYPVLNEGPFVLNGERYFNFAACLGVHMSSDLVKIILAAVEGFELVQYDGVYIESLGRDFDPLEWFPARALKPLANDWYVESNKINRAAWAYLIALDDDNPVGLHWAP